MQIYQGIPVSPGIAMGEVFLLEAEGVRIPEHFVGPGDCGAEVERLKPLVELGGYIPCPDHRIAPDAKWDLVRYYCDRMRAEFS